MHVLCFNVMFIHESTKNMNIFMYSMFSIKFLMPTFPPLHHSGKGGSCV